jgi:hypothetical protein
MAVQTCELYHRFFPYAPPSCTVADLYEFAYIRHWDFAPVGCANAEPVHSCRWVKAPSKGTWTNKVAWRRRGVPSQGSVPGGI